MKPLARSTGRFIRKSAGRFIAIFAIIALGVGFFSGLTVSKSAMLLTGNDYLNEHSFFDYRLISTLGFSKDDPAKLENEGYILAAEGSKFKDALFAIPNKTVESIISVHSLTYKINTLSLTEGRLPEKDGECVLDTKYYDKSILGKKLKLADDNTDDTKNSFSTNEFTVVGLAHSPLYLNFERGATSVGDGTVDCFMYIPDECFTFDYYTEVFIKLHESAFIYTDEYKTIISKYSDSLKKSGEELASARHDSIIEEVRKKYQDGENEYNAAKAEYDAKKSEAEAKLADAEAKLDDAKNKIESGETELNNKENELAAGEKKLSAAETEYDNGLALYQEGLTKYNKSLSDYNEAYIQFDKGLASYNAVIGTIDSLFDWADSELQKYCENIYSSLEKLLKNWDIDISIDPGAVSIIKLKDIILDSSIDPVTKLKEAKKALDETEALLNNAKTQLDAGKAKLDDSKAQLDSAKTQLDTGKAELSAGKAAIASARTELERGKAEYETGVAAFEASKAEGASALSEGEAKLDTAHKQLDDAKAQIDKIEEAQVYVLDRTSNTGYVCFENDSTIVEGISKVFPIFFFLVAALVCITTMTRMVEENRTHIGTLKAIGYRNAAIASQYIIYSGSAAITGAVAGYFAGSYLFPTTIWLVYGIMYGFAPLELVFDPLLFAVSAAVALLCSVGTSFIACWRSLSECAASLIRPKAPKNGKRILLEHVGFIWKKLKFLYKVSFRNIFRYKSRMTMMILGIGGCTALLLTGFGLGDSISNLARFQFDQITVYDYCATFTKALSDKEIDEIKAKYADITDGILFAHSSSADLVLTNGVKNVNIIAAEKSTDGYIDLHRGDEKITYPGKGEVVLTSKLAKKSGFRLGDDITLRRSDMSTVTLKLTGICDNYVYNFAFITLDTCRELWGYEPDIKSAFVIVNDDGSPETDEVHSSAAVISKDSLCAGVTINADTREYVEKMMFSLNYIIVLICACAAALAFIVVYNLTNINITERSREIATIKVLGFRRGETGAYVFRENLALSVAGALAGLILGKFLHTYVMSCIDIDMVTFDVHITPLSYLFAFAMTVAFACIVDLLMFFKLEKIDMANSLKSIE